MYFFRQREHWEREMELAAAVCVVGLSTNLYFRSRFEVRFLAAIFF